MRLLAAIQPPDVTQVILDCLDRMPPALLSQSKFMSGRGCVPSIRKAGLEGQEVKSMRLAIITAIAASLIGAEPAMGDERNTDCKDWTEMSEQLQNYFASGVILGLAYSGLHSKKVWDNRKGMAEKVNEVAKQLGHPVIEHTEDYNRGYSAAALENTKLDLLNDTTAGDLVVSMSAECIGAPGKLLHQTAFEALDALTERRIKQSAEKLFKQGK